MPNCRHCGSELTETFADLGMQPLANAFIKPADRDKPETFYPLHAFVCSDCKLVQLPEYCSPKNIFTDDYPYFSSQSKTWLAHAEKFTYETIDRLRLDWNSRVIEIGSNDGYLLQNFMEEGIPCIGIEPAQNVAEDARKKGIYTRTEFFDSTMASWMAGKDERADLIVANNVLAHVPDINDFVRGVSILLKSDGVAVFEFPHLLRLMMGNQFDTIYHEHFSYLSLLAVEQILERQGLYAFDVEELDTHGGSLRLWIKRYTGGERGWRVLSIRKEEHDAGLDNLETYRKFAKKPVEVKCGLMDHLVWWYMSEKKVVGYGAPAKGNTLLNYCGIKPGLLPFTVDTTRAKQGCLMPGSHIPVYEEQALFDAKPDYVLILPWNWRDEIVGRLSRIREWGGKFVVAIPELEIF